MNEILESGRMTYEDRGITSHDNEKWDDKRLLI